MSGSKSREDGIEFGIGCQREGRNGAYEQKI